MAKGIEEREKEQSHVKPLEEKVGMKNMYIFEKGIFMRETKKGLLSVGIATLPLRFFTES